MLILQIKSSSVLFNITHLELFILTISLHILLENFSFSKSKLQEKYT